MAGSVKDMIRAIRSCRTPAEEKAVIARESAVIRNAINGNSSSERRKNIAKLLLIHLMGHSTHFGRMECVNLVASGKFPDKRMAYLALSLILTEDSEFLTLAINSIKMDLNGGNVYAAEAALNLMSNLGNQEMFRELYYDLDRLVRSPEVNIRKRAIICIARMLRKLGQANLVPGPEAMELATNYFHMIPVLLGDHNHGVIMAGLNLLEVIIEYYPKCCTFSSIYDLLLKTLHTICNEPSGGIGVMFGGGRDYEINGVTDPFLKVKLLSLVRIVYQRCRDELPGNQQLYDAISQVIKGATLANNASHSLLYECVRTIYSEMDDPKFNQLGKDVVQKFITTNDNNIKYIALGVLNNLRDVTLVVGDNNWNIVVQSLRQPDISIRRRALEVTLKLMSRDTVKPLMQHLYDFLLAANDELKRESVTKIEAALRIHSINEFYRLETMVKIFSIAGNCVSETILHSFIASVSASSHDTKVKVTTKLFYIVPNNLGQDALVRAALWCLGEYGHLLPPLSHIDVSPTSVVTSSTAPKSEASPLDDLLGGLDESVPTNDASGPPNTNTASQVVHALEPIARHIVTCSSKSGGDCINGEYLLTCLGKLACHVPGEIAFIMRIVKQFRRHVNAELQQRAGELEALHEQNMLGVVVTGDLQLITPSIPASAPTDKPVTIEDDLLGLTDTPVNKPSAQKIDTLDFMSFEYKDSTKIKNNDEFGDLLPF
ncbi:Adaptin N terminal region family protein [Babesia bovis T2Bo]|uniref:AP-1 complex subunit gamma n=1 Tax=Babesia bovis TaxID=5865 RepID=A7ATR2_BABBO|nr:Adaptin N terminal region family protein [Babesia bovis T2Bo]EDO06323.1 Adaptin N terminal region family protein [Babesia bovis T2Bo]|eukprot:XP_001609891.1 adaptin N terminal region family protein [Babesia bovis T2Bo]